MSQKLPIGNCQNRNPPKVGMKVSLKAHVLNEVGTFNRLNIQL